MGDSKLKLIFYFKPCTRATWTFTPILLGTFTLIDLHKSNLDIHPNFTLIGVNVQVVLVQVNQWLLNNYPSSEWEKYTPPLRNYSYPQ